MIRLLKQLKVTNQWPKKIKKSGCPYHIILKWGVPALHFIIKYVECLTYIISKEIDSKSLIGFVDLPFPKVDTLAHSPQTSF